jgi:hypothetical protein
LDVVRRVLLGRSVYVTLEREEESMEVKCTLIISMENG